MPTLKEFEFFGVDITTLSHERLIELGYVTPLNELPVIIDGPGKYRTRDRHTVTIHEVAPTRTLAETAYSAKGTLHLGKPWRADPYTIWHVSGRHYPSPHLSGKDIVRKL